MMHFLLCDEIDAGKSRFCLGLAPRLLDAGVKVSGWITPAHMAAGTKIGHDFVAVEDGRLAAPIPFTRLAPFEGSFPWRRFHFNAQAFERANLLADGAVRRTTHDARRTNLFIMDEIGPLELDDRRGFFSPMMQLLASASPAIVVVRRGLEDGLRAICRGRPITVYSLADKIALVKNIVTRCGGRTPCFSAPDKV